MTDTRESPTTDGDVVERILEDHRLFEDLLRECRRTDRDRAAARTALAEVLVAHAVAEEEKVYPSSAVAEPSPATRRSTARRSTPRSTRRSSPSSRPKGTDTQKYDDTPRGARHGGQPPRRRGGDDDPQPRPRGGPEERRAELGVAWLARGATSCSMRAVRRRSRCRAFSTEAEEEGVLAPEGARRRPTPFKEDAKKTAEEIEERGEAGVRRLRRAADASRRAAPRRGVVGTVGSA